MTKEERQEIRANMFSLIKESEESRLSQKEFIETKGIRPYVFYYWKKQYQNSKKPQKKKAPFLPISITMPPQATTGQIEFFLPNGIRAVITGENAATALHILIGL